MGAPIGLEGGVGAIQLEGGTGLLVEEGLSSPAPIQPTSIPQFTADQIAARIASNIPRGWVSDAAKQPGGVTYALLYSVATQFSFLLSEIQYAFSSSRLQTAVAPELDLAGEDFFGSSLPRPTGASDDTYRALLLANLPPTGATRQAMSDAIEAITGQVPRLIEPWNPGDTGCRDTIVSYRDIDNVNNPFLTCNPGDRYQGFVETILPPVSNIGNNPVLTRDDGGYRDTNLYRVIVQLISGLQQLYDAINKVHPFGTITWVKIVPSS